MALVINGNGAVTGLTALPSSAMASGSVIQTITESTNAIITISGTTPVELSTDLRATIVPKNANNIIIITVVLGVVSCSSSNVATLKVLKDGTDIVDAFTNTVTSSGNGQFWTNAENMTTMTMHVSELAGNTNSRYYSPFGRSSGTNSFLVNSYRISGSFLSSSRITVTEVSV